MTEYVYVAVGPNRRPVPAAAFHRKCSLEDWAKGRPDREYMLYYRISNRINGSKITELVLKEDGQLKDKPKVKVPEFSLEDKIADWNGL